MRICVPSRPITLIRLITPNGPAAPFAAAEHFQAWPPTARFNNIARLIGLAAMLTLHRLDHVDLTSARIERSGILATDAEQQQFRDVAEVKADSAAIGAPILTHLVPDNIRNIAETPSIHNAQTTGQERIGPS